MPACSEVEEKKLALEALMKKKDETEELILAYREQARLGEVLVDRDGFPRADLDLVAVRTARNKVVCLQNDHKAMMKQIENALALYHQAQRNKNAKPKFVEQQPHADWKAFASIHKISVGILFNNVQIFRAIFRLLSTSQDSINFKSAINSLSINFCTCCVSTSKI